MQLDSIGSLHLQALRASFSPIPGLVPPSFPGAAPCPEPGPGAGVAAEGGEGGGGGVARRPRRRGPGRRPAGRGGRTAAGTPQTGFQTAPIQDCFFYEVSLLNSVETLCLSLPFLVSQEEVCGRRCGHAWAVYKAWKNVFFPLFSCPHLTKTGKRQSASALFSRPN